MIKTITFRNFLSGYTAYDYIFSDVPYSQQIKNAAQLINDADDILIGAGAGLSAAAGLTYSGTRFINNFQDFIKKYNIKDMYSAGFYPFPGEEERWGYWSKHVMMNRILPPELPLYQQLYELVKDKNYFVLTTNADHQFHKAGFDEERIFATQGDYGLIQCMKGCHPKTYDNTKMIIQMDQARKDCKVPSYMVPRCPVCGGLMTMNLRCDQYFVEDENWDKAEKNFSDFLSQCQNHKVVLLELGVGFNTPAIIRFPFEKMIREHENIALIRLNLKEAMIPDGLENRAIGINHDLNESIQDLCQKLK